MLGLIPTKKRSIDRVWGANIHDHVSALRWSSDGKLLAAASVSGPIHVFDGRSGVPIVALPGHGFGTTSISWRPKHNTLASSGQDGKLRIWNPDNPAECLVADGGAAWVEYVAWSPSGRYLASGAGRKLRLWSPEGELLHEYPDHPSTIGDVVWKPSTDDLTSAGYGVLYFWSPESSEAVRKFEWKGSMLKIAWSPDGKALCTGNQDATAHFWFVATGKDLQMSGYPTKIRELSWDAKSRYLATGGSATVIVWDCSGKGPANTKPLLLNFHDKLIQQLTFQHRGPLLASGCEAGAIALWRVGKDQKPVGSEWLEHSVAQLAWSPDDALLAAGDAVGGVSVFRSPV